MRTFRTAIFWMHLAAGLGGGLVIGLMAVTGATMAFEKQIIAWAERDIRHFSPPASGASRRSLAELQANFRAIQPDARGASLSLSSDPTEVVTFTTGRDSIFYVNPYTGAVVPAAAARWRAFFHTAEDCHRWLTLSGDRRNLGKGITGAAAFTFFFLCVSGLYLWWPRSLTWRGFKAVLAFNFKLTGKTRDFNWHNVLGFWCLPMLLISTTTGTVMSYRWANDALFRLTGTEPPAQEAPLAAPTVEIVRPGPDAHPLSADVLITSAQREFPGWDVITYRSDGGRTRGGRSAGQEGQARREAESNGPGGEMRRSGPPSVTLSIHEPGQWPRTATTSLTLNPYTGEVLRREVFADQSAGRQARTWARYLHTGEALGLGGQALMALGALGACFLVYTGFALAWRRFFGRKAAA